MFWFNKVAKDEAVIAIDQLHGIESELKALRSMTHRMVLTQHEMVGGCCRILLCRLAANRLKFLFGKFYFCRKRLFSKGVGLRDTGA